MKHKWFWCKFITKALKNNSSLNFKKYQNHSWVFLALAQDHPSRTSQALGTDVGIFVQICKKKTLPIS